jgi:hypothetical protein
VTTAYLVSSIGCTATRVGPATAQQPLRLQATPAVAPAANAVSYAEATSGVALASYDSPASSGELLSATPADNYDGFDVDQVVRGQDDHGYGPIREFLWSPYTIGALFVAAIVIPAAFAGADDDDNPIPPPP